MGDPGPVIALAAGLTLVPHLGAAGEPDWRNITTGLPIPAENYADQPYVVITHDDNWLCTLTTGLGEEGAKGQHIIATISADKGRTWSEPVDIEPADGPEASWVMPLVVPSGRVYAFYVYNGDKVNGRRSDMLGWYCFKYSDDNGRTWSREPCRIPMRTTPVDLSNDYGGKVLMFWGIGKPVIVGDSVVFGFSKIGKYLVDRTEGWFFGSDNILHETDPSRIRSEMLPEGDQALQAPEHGSVQEEQNLVPLSNGDLYCMYRTTQGYPCHSYSRDGGRTWTRPEAATHSPGGRQFKNPRACPRIWRCRNGKFLFWFHNHGVRGFSDRNPAWISGGVERDGFIHWSQPEILLYSHDLSQESGRISYPDLIEQDGRYWVTETQKTTARVHEVPAELLEGMWNEGENRTVATEGLVLELGADQLGAAPTSVPMPELPDLAANGGFAVDLWLELESLEPGQVILSSGGDAGAGIAVSTANGTALQLQVSNGKAMASWDTDPGLLRPGERHHVVFIVDGGPDIITVVVDGLLCDGGDTRQYGWGRFDTELTKPGGGPDLRIAPSLQGRVLSLRIYDRYLRTAEAVGNFHAGLR